MTNIEKHRELMDLIHETYKRKNADYGDSFTKSIEEWGTVAALVRIEDKINRLKNLSKNPDNAKVNESLIDTCLDGANYLIMLAMYLEDDDYDKIYGLPFKTPKN